MGKRKDKRKEKNKEIEENIDTNKHRLAKLKICIMLLIILMAIYVYQNMTDGARVLRKYYGYLSKKDYDKMYSLLDTDVSKEEFEKAIKSFYDNIEAKDIKLRIKANFINENKNDIIHNIGNNISEKFKNNKTNEVEEVKEEINKEEKIEEIKEKAEKENVDVSYKVQMNTVAGPFNFSNKTNIINKNNVVKIKWTYDDIYPGYKANSRLVVNKIEADRGKIYDRNNIVIADNVKAYNIGIIPSKMNNIEDAKKLEDIISETDIYKRVKEAKNKDNTIWLKKIEQQDYKIKNEALNIKGVIVDNIKMRYYQYKDVLGNVTGYTRDRKGVSGAELSYDKMLEGRDGVEVYVYRDGKKYNTVIKQNEISGKDIKLTVDAKKQSAFYEDAKDDKAAIVQIDYKTGETLVSLSTKFIDVNEFTNRVTEDRWNEISNSDEKILFDKTKASYVPGSVFKPIIGSIALEKGLIDNSYEDENVGYKWKKEEWSDFYITSAVRYNEPRTLENAIAYSDNIFFARLANLFKINDLKYSLDQFGFNKNIAKDVYYSNLENSVYGKIESDKELSSLGYGQANLLMSPVLMASIYSSFANGGNMVEPYMLYDEGKEKIYKANIIKEEVADEIKKDLREAVVKGTAKELSKDKFLAAKTGTAEIKKDKEDKTGNELGWLVCFDDDSKLTVAMFENTKNRGGSHYTLQKIKDNL